MDAAGFEIVMIETVGVGQDEVEVARTADVTLVLLVPGMGDDVQTMKAGIMEIGDVFVINKADHAGVERIEAELSAVLSITGRRDGWKPAVVKTVASEGKGIDDLARAITSWCERQRASGSGQEKAVRTQRDRLLEVARSEVMRALLRRPGAAERLDDLARKLANREIDPYTAAEQFLSSR
jgi:LAO/AO transport system kinase